MLDKITDPVCGMSINPNEALAQTNYRGQTYYFCSQECKEKFEKQPEKYTAQVPEPHPTH
jgi:Cu+-exporting ATPase